MDAEKVLGFLKDNLFYDKPTGNFLWLSDRAGGKVKKGSVAGSTTNRGYRQIKVFGKWYKAHRLVWLIETGDWPKGQIDHINRDNSDNRFVNLRDVTNYQNCLNRVSKNGLPVGVTYDKKNRLWLAQTYKDGRAINLGRYKTIELAERVYLDANKERLVGVQENNQDSYLSTRSNRLLHSG